MYLFTKMDQVFSKENKTQKKYWKIEKKNWKSRGILSVRKSGNPDNVCDAPPPLPVAVVVVCVLITRFCFNVRLF